MIFLFIKEDQNERRFMEELACSAVEAHDATNGGSSHGGTTRFNRMAILL